MNQTCPGCFCLFLLCFFCFFEAQMKDLQKCCMFHGFLTKKKCTNTPIIINILLYLSPCSVFSCVGDLKTCFLGGRFVELFSLNCISDQQQKDGEECFHAVHITRVWFPLILWNQITNNLKESVSLEQTMMCESSHISCGTLDHLKLLLVYFCFLFFIYFLIFLI